jgi:hypothetical protein
MRLVFFLEESPNELRSLVDFMNKQLKDTEVILVEARWERTRQLGWNLSSGRHPRAVHLHVRSSLVISACRNWGLVTLSQTPRRSHDGLWGEASSA